MELDSEWCEFLSNSFANSVTNQSILDIENNVSRKTNTTLDSIMYIENETNTLNTTDYSYRTNKLDQSKKMKIKGSIYISTKTKIGFLNNEIDIYSIFWNIPILNYYSKEEGIIKKEIKVTSFNQEESNEITNKCCYIDNCRVHELSFIHETNRDEPKYKHTQKIEIGMCNKDMIKNKVKKKSAFYNCFALILRLKYNNAFKEVHIKLFNTGKLEIPGIQHDELMFKAIDFVCAMLSSISLKNYSLKKNSIETVLINSNFNCGFLVNRQNLYVLLKQKYNILTLYDQCSYPGTQSKFYYNYSKEKQNGICECSKKCSKKGTGYGDGQCKEISFMVFRTGSILIVGHCDETILNEIYIFIKDILETEYENINDGVNKPKEKKIVQYKKKYTIYTEK